MQFAGLFPWAPSGIVSQKDEEAQALALVNPWTEQAQYLHDAADLLDHGDETIEPNVFGYIPTELQVGAALAALNMQVMATPSPVETHGPSLSQLSASLYAQSAELWQEIAAADTYGWNV